MKQRPIYRILYRARDSYDRVECGTIWPPHERAPDFVLGGLRPCTEATGGQYPTMSLEEACRRAANGEGFIDVNRVKSDRDRDRPAPSDDGAAQGQADAGEWAADQFQDDIPF